MMVLKILKHSLISQPNSIFPFSYHYFLIAVLLFNIICRKDFFVSARFGRSPVKIFILAGDDAAEGFASTMELRQLVSGEVNATVRAQYQHLFEADGKRFLTRDDVFITYDHVRTEEWLKGPLRIGGDATHPGFASSILTFGPEVEMGHLLGNIFDEPVVIVKSAWAHRNLAQDFRSPSASDKDGKSASAGAQYNRLITSVQRTIDNLDKVLTGDSLLHYRRSGHEVVGMVWFHGYSDFINPIHRTSYHANLQHFFRDVTRALKQKGREFYIVIGELGGQGKHSNVTSEELSFRAMQKTMCEEQEFKDSTKFVRTALYVRPRSEGNYVTYYDRADTMIYIGSAFAGAMMELMFQYGISGSSNYQIEGDIASFMETGATKLMLAVGIFLVGMTCIVAICCGGGLSQHALRKGWDTTMNSVRWMIPTRPRLDDDGDDSGDSDSDSSDESDEDHVSADERGSELTPVSRKV